MLSFFVPLFIIFVVGVIIYSIFMKPKRVKQSGTAIEEKLNQLRREITVVASSAIPGRNIARVFGNVTGISDTQATSKDEFALAEKEAMFNLIGEAKKLGANAIVDMKLNTGTYQQTGSQWQVSQVVYTGTAVQI